MIKAGSLFYAIIISIIIAIVSSSFILFAYLSRIEFDNQQLQQRLNLNVLSGMNLLMSRQSLVKINQTKIIDLYASGEDSVLLTRKSWGAFEVLRTIAFFHRFKVERMAQTGCPVDSSDLFSIYLADEGKPLALCGDTKISGTAYLPKAGLERAYMEGQSYTGTQLIYGEVKKSKKELPVFNPELIEQVKQLLKEKRITDTDSVMEMQRPFSGDSIHNSFKNNALVLKYHGPITIANGTYSGNVAIISDTVIYVEASAVLQDVIIAAPKIFFSEGFKGQLQAFASDSIIVNRNVTLAYPSVLGIMSFDPAANSAIVLSENDTLTGNVFAHQVVIDAYKRTGVYLDKKSVIIGQVYSSGFIDIQGSVYGSLMCSKFMLKTPSSVYENHLLNVEINRSKLPGYFTGLAFAKTPRCKYIVKWLD